VVRLREALQRHRMDVLAFAGLAAIALAGLVLRTTGMATDRPYVYYPDEWTIAKPAMRMAASGDLNPHLYLYPLFLTYVETGIAAVFHFLTGVSLTIPPLTSRIAGLPSGSQADFPPSLFPYVLWGRRFVAFLAVLTCVLVAVAARSAARARTPSEPGDVLPPASPTVPVAWLAGLVGAGFVAVAALSVDFSRVLTTDVPSAFFCAAVMASSVAAMMAGERRRSMLFLLAGLSVGLATSTKYNAVVVAIVPATAYMAGAESPGKLPRFILSELRSPLPYLIVLASVVGFVIATPLILFDAPDVLAGAGDQISTYNVIGHTGAEGNAVGFYVDYLWNTGLGPVLGVLAAAGIAWALVRHRPVDLVLAIFPVVYFILVSIPVVRFERNLLPLVPFVAVLAGRFVAETLELCCRRLAGRSPALGAAVVAASLVALSIQPVAMAIGDARTATLPDTRTVALRWATANLPEHAAVIREAYTPQLAATRYRVAYTLSLSDHSLDWYRSNGFEYAIASDAQYFRYLDGAHPEEAAFYDQLFRLPVVYRASPNDRARGPTVTVFDLTSG
jgi:hypothetical protein